MKTLYLVRHGKSDWSDTKLKDFDRPLNSDGHKGAVVLGKQLKAKGLMPELILSSPAVRAITTASLLAKEIGYKIESIETNPEIYNADYLHLLEVVNGLDDDKDSVMLVGHNPGMSLLASQMAERNIDDMPTCAIYGVNFNILSWQEVSPHKGTSLFYNAPG